MIVWRDPFATIIFLLMNFIIFRCTQNFVYYFPVGNQGNQWFQTVVSIGRRRTPFTIEFEAMRGVSWDGDIAIDSISLLSYDKPAQCKGSLPSDTQR